jgi:uncharacterized protein
MKTMPAIAAVLFTLALSLPAAGSEADVLRGNWKGTLQIPPMEMRIWFRFEDAKGGGVSGFLVSPDQSPEPIPMSKVTMAGDAVAFEVAAAAGIYTGRLDRAARRMAGTWSQGGVAFPLAMAFTADDWNLKRPQTPKPPFPHATEEVKIENKKQKVTLAGTLSLPMSKGPFAAVVTITGSGPEDRDETIFQHKPFAVIADHLTRQGFAVLRYDDRGVGGSSGDPSKATTADFSSDAEAALDYLKSRPDIDGTRIGFLGHSEGGMIAPMIAARRDDVAFLVLLAAPGVSGESTAKAQSETFARLAGYSEELIRDSRPLVDEAFRLYRSGASEVEKKTKREELRQRSVALMSDNDRKIYESHKHLEPISEAIMDAPWTRFFIGYDPATDLRRVKCPVLALNGEKDTQVAAAGNIGAIERALKAGGNTNVTAQVLPGLNHLFQVAKTGDVKEYVKIEETIHPPVLSLISDWMRKTTTR